MPKLDDIHISVRMGVSMKEKGSISDIPIPVYGLYSGTECMSKNKIAKIATILGKP